MMKCPPTAGTLLTVISAIFLPLTLLIYYAIPKKYVTAKNIELLIASLIFYAWGEPRLVVLMLITVSAGYVFGLLTDLTQRVILRRLYLILSLVFKLFT